MGGCLEVQSKLEWMGDETHPFFMTLTRAWSLSLVGPLAITVTCITPWIWGALQTIGDLKTAQEGGGWLDSLAYPWVGYQDRQVLATVQTVMLDLLGATSHCTCEISITRSNHTKRNNIKIYTSKIQTTALR